MAIQPYVGIDDIIGAAIDGDDQANEQLKQIFGQDISELGIDDIIGAVAQAQSQRLASGQIVKRPAMLQQLAQLKAAGQRGVISRTADDLKYELLPIPVTVIAAAGIAVVNIIPIRSQRIDRVDFDAANADHGFIALVGYQILGTEQMNGAGGIRLSQLSHLRTEPLIRGGTAQAGQAVIMTYQNLDAVNARTLWGCMSGPSLRV